MAVHANVQYHPARVSIIINKIEENDELDDDIGDDLDTSVIYTPIWKEQTHRSVISPK